MKWLPVGILTSHNQHLNAVLALCCLNKPGSLPGHFPLVLWIFGTDLAEPAPTVGYVFLASRLLWWTQFTYLHQGSLWLWALIITNQSTYGSSFSQCVRCSVIQMYISAPAVHKVKGKGHHITGHQGPRGGSRGIALLILNRDARRERPGTQNAV
jgi:hypothetical protein